MSPKSFIPEIPSHWDTCPIYAEGVLLPKKSDNDPDTFSKGKTPLGLSWSKHHSVSDSRLFIEKEPEKFKALGVFTGARSGGLVMFDVDRNLGAIQKKWGSDLKKAPKVTSKKPNAAKFLFLVPEKHWVEVHSVSHSGADNEGWEILWNGQGVVAGEYYKKEYGKGEYQIEGDLDNIPDAPEWLLSRMRKAHDERYAKIDVKYVDNRWSKRTKEEKVAIASSCLSVIQYKGKGELAARYWWEIGASINKELPGEEGLKLWREWSKNDPDYIDDWEDGNDPCAARWYQAWKHDGATLNMGNLIKTANFYDPNKRRLERDGLLKLVEEVESIPLRFKEEILGGNDVIKKYQEIDEDPENENPALHNQAVHKLAIEAKRSNAAEIERLVDSYEMFKRTNNQKPLSVEELDDTPFDYTIPGLLPKPWTLLLHADGGTGKTAMCQTIAKHVGHGKAFNVHGGLVTVPSAKILWLNGDQNERILRRQMQLIGCTKNIRIVTEWDMQWYSRFKKMQNKYAYDLVIIDSLDGCNDSNPYEENRREYALPIKKLVRRNGQDFPACSIIIIHHNTKEGKFRGTTAIRNAVDETWNMRKLSARDAAEMNIAANSRLVTVEKSRDDREGLRMLFTLLPDYTYSVTPAPDPVDIVRVDNPNQHTLDILALLRSSKKAWSIKDLVENERVGGVHRKRAITYSITKLEDQKLIEKAPVPSNSSVKGGRPCKYYQAIGKDVPSLFRNSLPRDIPQSSLLKPNNPVVGTDSINKEDCKNSDVVKTPEDEGEFLQKEVFTKPIVNETSSTGTEEGFYTQDSGNKGEKQNSWNMWDV